ncbi:MAG: DNA repair protein RecN [Lachnospiraceae bacterium]|nr:DNA repair protein RecN [Agathobacter sp.]MDD6445952.1 DNA repair protein RecN [Lachnospiraceae bacterium]MDY4894157.1 DNA repair protein RecN [Agathobacter sp.]
MLQSLHVKNLALIKETEITLKDGLNILTGETGAGKSIIIGSVSLALGEKVPKELLREGDDTALVELVFFVENPKVLEKIRSLGIEAEDETVILSRKITAGRAIARVNGEAVSVSKLKEVASLLIDIHGQHEHQSLLSKKKHLEILDAYAKDALGDKKIRLSACFHEYQKLKKEWDSSNTDSEERARELSFLEYEVKEIEDANLLDNEDAILEEQYKKFANGKQIMDAVSMTYGATGGDGECASELIGRALRGLGTVSQYDEKLAGMEQSLTDIDNLLSDFNHEIASYLSEEEFDEEVFYQTEKRLDEINHLKSKYGSTIEEIKAAAEEKSKRIAVLRDYDTYLEKLRSSLDLKKRELDALCTEVSEIRQKEAGGLSDAIAQALEDLNFLDVQFSMEFRQTDYSANGTDEAEFMISTNPGEPVKPLAKVASGGELSRIALAVKTVMADTDEIPTLIFDEIDSGISGRTAQMVSQKMKLLAGTHQIICITHLPQIAAMADVHFLIEKSVENNETISRIHPLNEEESVQELARMLGGVEITDTVIQNAREMKALAQRITGE